MRLQRLPKALWPVTLAACSLAMAQENPSAPAEPVEKQTELAPPQPVEIIPADPSQAPPEDDGDETTPAPVPVPANPRPPAPRTVAPAPPPGTETDEQFQKRMHDLLHPGNAGTPAPSTATEDAAIPGVEPTGLPPVSGTDSTTTIGLPPSVTGDPTIGAPPPGDADAMTNLDVAAPDSSVSDREWLRGFGFGGVFTAMYDTNVYQASGLRGIPEDDDLVFAFKPYISYGSDKYGVVYSAKLVLDADEYVSHSDISGVGYAADFELGYDGRKFRNEFAIASQLAQGVDRNYGAYVQRQIFKVDEILAYKYSRKTSFEGRIGYSSESPDDRRFFDTSREYANLAIAWQTSPLLQLSGGLGWTRSEGDRQATRDTVGPLLRANYALSSKLTIDGEAGLDFVSYDSGGSNDVFFSTRITATYVPSRFWAFDLSILRDTVPDGSIAGSYRELFSIRAGVKKKISKGSVSLGLGYEQNQYTREGSSTLTAGLDRDYFTVDLVGTYPLYRDRLDVEVFTKYRDESADDSTRSWSGTQFGVSLRSTF